MDVQQPKTLRERMETLHSIPALVGWVGECTGDEKGKLIALMEGGIAGSDL